MAHTGQLSAGPERRPPNPSHRFATALPLLAHVPSPKPWQAYVVAVVATALATAIRWWLGRLVGQNLPPFITYYPLVIFAALFGGTGPGLLATALATLAVKFLFLAPVGSIAVAHPADQVGIALFMAINLAVSLVCGALRAARQHTFAEARRAEASEQRLRATFQQAALGILEVDTQDRITAANQRAHEILGYPPDQLLGMFVHDLTHPNDRARSDELNLDIHEGRRARFEYEKRYLRHDGSPIWVRVAVSPLRDSQGRDYGSIGTFEDVTDRKRAEEALKFNEQRYRSFVEVTNQVIWRMDSRGGVDQPIPSWNALTGQTDEQAAGFGWMNAIHPEDRPRVTEAWQAASAAKSTYQVEYRLRRHDGRWLRILARGVPIFDPDGSVREYIGSCNDITAQREAEENLRQSEGKYRAIFEQAAIGIGRVGFSDARWIDVNDAFCRIVGYTPDFMRATPWPQITHPDDVDSDLIPFRRMAAGELDSYSVEKRFIHANGNVVWARLTLSLVRDAEGRPDYEIAIIENIDARKRAEFALQAAKDRIETILASITDSFFALDRDLRFTYVNSEAQRVLRKTSTELLGGYLAELFPHAEAFLAQYQQVLATGKPAQFEEFYAPLQIWFEVHAYPSPEGVSVYFRDITARRRAQDALRQSEERFSAFMRHLPGAAWMKDPTGRYVYANPEAERIFSTPAHALRGKRDEELFPSETARQFRENDHRALAEGGKLQTTEVLRQPDGVDHHSIISKFAVLGPDGRPAYVGGVAFDITDRIRAEQALRQAKDDLARANADLEKKVQQRTAKLEETVAELEHFSYTITHDMRAPLRAITGYAGILDSLEAQCLTDQGRDLLRRISESALRMDQLITDALQYSRVVRDQFPLQPIEPAAAIRGIVESYPQFQPPHARITVQPEMPRVLANPAAFTQVFSNLLGNAVKFVTPGQVPEINVTAEIRPSCLNSQPSTDCVRLSVADNGIGIPREYHEKVWQMFQRLSKKYEGTGIGLALVRKVVERMAGRVGLESAPDQGSRFWIELQKAP